MHEFGLTHAADRFVGDKEKRDFGGERKRVCNGVELIHNPSILLLDEPTSGLASTSALQVIELLDSMARAKKRTVVLSIHQPSYRILQYISNFLILSHSAVVHNGSLELLEETINKLGYQIPVQLNAIEFAMEIMHTLEDSYSRNNYLSTNEDHEQYFYSISEELGRVQQHNEIHQVDTSFLNFYEIIVLFSRFSKIMHKTKQLFLARTMQALTGGFGLGSVNMKVRKDEAVVAERLGLFAFSLSFLLSSTVEALPIYLHECRVLMKEASTVEALPIYLQERRVLMKEASREAYRISSCLIVNKVVFLPFLVAVALLFSIPVYWIVGLNPSMAAFDFFTFVVWLIVLMASSLLLFLSAVPPDFISGNSLICTFLGAFFLFSIYFIPKENIPKYWIFMYYVSLYRYPLICLLKNEYWRVRRECFPWHVEDQTQYSKCLFTGNDVLKNRGLKKDTRWMNVGIVFAFFVFYRVLCWFILIRRASKTTI